MFVPTFSDIGKANSDLISKDFPAGAARLEVNTLTNNGVKFTVLGAKDNATNHITAEIKSKYADKLRGYAITETWTTANQVSAKLELQDSLARGLKLDVDASIFPAKATQNLKATAHYVQPYLSIRTSVDLFKGPTLAGDAVVGNDGFVVGADAAYDVTDARLTKYNAAAAYITPEYSFSLHATEALNRYTAAYFHRVNRDLEAGASASWAKTSDSGPQIAVAAKKLLDPTAFVKAKIDNKGLLGLGYQQLVRTGVKFTVGGLFDTARLHDNAHKLGFTVTFEG